MKVHGKLAIAAALTALMSFSAIPAVRAQSGASRFGENGGLGGGSRGDSSGSSGSASGSSSGAHDPGPRAGTIGAGRPLSTLNGFQLEYFRDGLVRFNQTDSVSGAIPGEKGSGLGPGYNSNSCESCHAQPSAAARVPAQSHFRASDRIRK